MADESKTADETTTSTKAETDKDPGAESTSSGTDTATTASGGAGPEGGPVPGDPSSEPVATAAQSYVAGRVGPPTIAQDAAATHHAPEGVEQIEPGAVADAATPFDGGAIAQPPVPSELGAGPYGSDTPAPEAPNVVYATKPGTDLPGPDELPPNVPTASNKSASGGPVMIPAAGSGTKGAGQTSTASGPSGSPTLPTEGPASSHSPGSAEGAEQADSGSGGSATGPAESSGTSEPSGSAGSSTK